ncbi:hypothetical protein CMO86_00055 [Candidatus Woesearchaeota archaeon]|nr:hypothetical protein [Candidatus Woesearchaeota archaeon]
MSRARELAKLGNTDAIGIDGVDLRAGSVTKGTTLDVASDVKVVGVVTAANFFGEGSGLTGLTAVGSGVTVLRDDNSIGGASKINFDNTFTVTDLSSGITTIRSGVTTADPRSATLTVAGITTLAGTKLTGVTTASNQVNLENTNVTSGILTVSGQTILSNVNVTSGIATVAGQTTLSNLNVSGVTTAGIVTVNNNLFSANSTLSGITTITELNLLTDLEIAGFSTISNGGLDVVGVVTASSYRGDGSQLTGISGVGVGTTNVRTSSLVVSGLSTFNDDVTLDGGNLTFESQGDQLKFSTAASNPASGGCIEIKTSATSTATIKGSANQLLIFNDDNSSNSIDLRAATYSVKDNDAEYYALFNQGQVRLYHATAHGGISEQKFETDPGGVKITGVCTATSFSGSGSGLTGLNIPAGFNELDAALFN